MGVRALSPSAKIDFMVAKLKASNNLFNGNAPTQKSAPETQPPKID